VWVISAESGTWMGTLFLSGRLTDELTAVWLQVLRVEAP
jgi:hypothetical protein